MATVRAPALPGGSVLLGHQPDDRQVERLAIQLEQQRDRDADPDGTPCRFDPVASRAAITSLG
jgi:hypothetical protein